MQVYDTVKSAELTRLYGSRHWLKAGLLAGGGAAAGTAKVGDGSTEHNLALLRSVRRAAPSAPPQNAET